jgi:hypothetical protein
MAPQISFYALNHDGHVSNPPTLYLSGVSIGEPEYGAKEEVEGSILVSYKDLMGTVVGILAGITVGGVCLCRLLLLYCCFCLGKRRLKVGFDVRDFTFDKSQAFSFRLTACSILNLHSLDVIPMNRMAG